MLPRSGPVWHYHRSEVGQDLWEVVDQQGRIVATGIIDEADARLMAEAPNLLGALEAVLRPGTAFAISLALYAVDRAKGTPGV